MKINPVPAGFLAGILILSACSSLKPLTAKPTPAAISLKAPLTVQYFLGSETIPPPGDYTATIEDKGGYYYAAPAKLIGNGGRDWLHDGGLYLPKGATVPTHYYSVGQHHAISLHRLKKLAQYKSNPVSQ